jgi:hypothetical protein
MAWVMIYKKFKNYSGFFHLGKKHCEKDMAKPYREGDKITEHLERASWLTAQVESSGLFGTVNSYDGTGITAGIHQATAVFPRSDLSKNASQGTLWKLLYNIMQIEECKEHELWREFYLANYEIGEFGIYNLDDGYLLNGYKIRHFFNKSAQGRTPESGTKYERSAKLVRLVSDLFSMEKTFQIQIQHGFEFFGKFLKSINGEYPYINGKYNISHVDLAMCTLLSHSVNAPSVARKMLRQSFEIGANTSIEWACNLVRLLGNNKYGRWDDDLPNGRYQRTRLYAKRSGLWPESLFKDDGVMPKNIKE